MASFDIVSKVDLQTLDNAINNLKREILNRYDFRGTDTTIELNKGNNELEAVSVSDMQIRQIEESLISKLMKQGIDPKCLDGKDIESAFGSQVRKKWIIRAGISKEDAKKIIKLIKGSKSKVQAQIMDDQVRVTGKKIDDLQGVISLLKGQNLDFPLQFVNMKR